MTNEEAKSWIWLGDTYTTEREAKQVVEGQKVSRADADRDIDRRISTEFMPRAKAGVGEDVLAHTHFKSQAKGSVSLELHIIMDHFQMQL